MLGSEPAIAVRQIRTAVARSLRESERLWPRPPSYQNPRPDPVPFPRSASIIAAMKNQAHAEFILSKSLNPCEDSRAKSLPSTRVSV